MERETNFKQESISNRETTKKSLENLLRIADETKLDELRNHLFKFIEDEMKNAEITFKDIGITEEEFEKMKNQKSS